MVCPSQSNVGYFGENNLMRVLYNTYPMAFDIPGGGEMQLMAYRKYLPNYGIDPVLFDLWNPRLDEIDMVHFFSVVGGSSHFCSYVKKIGLPLVVTSSLWVTQKTRNLYPSDEIAYQLSLADIVVTNSEMESDSISEVYEIPREKCIAVYNGIENEFIVKEDPKLFIESTGIKEPFLLCVGNIEPRKNQLSLAKAIKSYPELKIVLIGYIRDQGYAKQVVEEAGNQLISFGPLPHGAKLLRSAMAACEAFVIPSTLETPSLAALEAAAQGAKILITEVGSTREYFKDMAVYLEPYSTDSIKDGIGQVINKDKTDLLEQHIIDNFLWSETIKKMANVYSNLAK